jgi:hypothetical protein
MNIETGLFDNMVLQRDAKDRSDQLITGTTDATGDVVAVVNGKRSKIGVARGGKFSGRLKGDRAARGR